MACFLEFGRERSLTFLCPKPRLIFPKDDLSSDDLPIVTRFANFEVSGVLKKIRIFIAHNNRYRLCGNNVSSLPDDATSLPLFSNDMSAKFSKRDLTDLGVEPEHSHPDAVAIPLGQSCSNKINDIIYRTN